MPVPVLELPAISTELVCAPVEIRDDAGVVVNPTAMALQLALPVAGVQPSAWFAGTWETRTEAHTWQDEGGQWHTWQPPVYMARLLVGPDGGAVATAVGVAYDLWVDVAPGGVERIKRVSGLVRAV
jgi:hypothetical protein